MINNTYSCQYDEENETKMPDTKELQGVYKFRNPKKKTKSYMVHNKKEELNYLKERTASGAGKFQNGIN